MSFQSAKQRAWMFANKPEMAKRWTSKYGSKPIEGLKKAKPKKKKDKPHS